MDLSLNDDQRLLAESAARFVANEYDLERRRALVAAEPGFSRDHWRTFAELGWLALPFAEADGGLGGGAPEVMVVMEQLGRGLAVEPYLACVLLAGQAIARAGNAGQRRSLLGPLIAGEAHYAFAHVEAGARYCVGHVDARAHADGDGWVLSGAKAVAFNAPAAHALVVSARSAGDARDADGVSLFVVPKDAAGLGIRPYRTIDGLRAGEVTLEGVRVGADALLGTEGAALPAIEEVIDRATAALCAEALGVMDRLREMTVAFLKTREQFGRPIGSFQALQHRAVDMLIACEEARSVTVMATLSLDKPARERARAVSAAKVQVGRSARLVGQEAVQLHGGMGMTEELALGHYFKRLAMIERTFGDVDHHLDRFAALDADVTGGKRT